MDRADAHRDPHSEASSPAAAPPLPLDSRPLAPSGLDAGARIEGALGQALTAAARRLSPCGAETISAPPLLGSAMRHAVFPGGARVRPRLCLAVAQACGDPDPAAADAAAAAVELLHCASLVHDDMPCFDDASTRRGRPSVHTCFGEPLALLAGDALIVLAFETLAGSPAACAPLTRIVARAVGAPGGIVAGQAWESEPRLSVSAYHRAKTGALFMGAAEAGAAAAGADPAAWRGVGAKLGEAYQAADDLADALSASEEVGKPVGQDAAHGRPNLVADLGVAGTVARLKELIDEAVAAVPPCQGAGALKELVRLQAKRLTPKSLAQSAA